jgi:hypothetical protein
MLMVMSIKLHAAAPAACCLLLMSLGIGHAAQAPYPQSTIVTGVTWDFSQTEAQRRAKGSDIWPLTWGADGDLYTAWGDGGGFGGSDAKGRVSIGFAKILGIPSDRSSAAFEGDNLWGAAPTFAHTQATLGGKIQSMFSVNGVLYAYGGIWTRENCQCDDPTKLDGDGPKDARSLMWSEDSGLNWQRASWTSDANVYFLNFGKDNWEARDGYVYEYYLKRNDASHVYLRRVRPGKLTAAPNTAKAREYLAAVDRNGKRVRWSSHEQAATPVFFDPANVSLPQVTYNAAIGRFLLTIGHNPGGKHATLSAGQLGFFEAPNPWGPWATIDYQDDWGNFGISATGAYLGLHIPAKWISADGTTFWAVFSSLGELDSFNLVKGTLNVSRGVPRITAPEWNATLDAGASYTAAAQGTALTWTAALHDGRNSEFARAKGSPFAFRVPERAQAGQFVRVTVTSAVATVYRDFAITKE